MSRVLSILLENDTADKHFYGYLIREDIFTRIVQVMIYSTPPRGNNEEAVSAAASVAKKLIAICGKVAEDNESITIKFNGSLEDGLSTLLDDFMKNNDICDYLLKHLTIKYHSMKLEQIETICSLIRFLLEIERHYYPIDQPWRLSRRLCETNLFNIIIPVSVERNLSAQNIKEVDKIRRIKEMFGIVSGCLLSLSKLDALDEALLRAFQSNPKASLSPTGFASFYSHFAATDSLPNLTTYFIENGTAKLKLMDAERRLAEQEKVLEYVEVNLFF